MNPAQASWNRIPNVCAPRRPYEMAPAPVARTTPASGSGAGSTSTSSGTGLATGLGLRSASTSRPRRTTMSAGSWGPSPTPSRRAPPPPPPAPAERTTPVCIPRTPDLPKVAVIPIPEVEDPFADAEPQHQDDLSPFPPARTRTGTRVSVPSYTMSLCVPPGLGASVPCAKDVRGRLVATTLLNRGSGRPLGVYLRRRLSGEGTTYVKSGLSQLVAAAA